MWTGQPAACVAPSHGPTTSGAGRSPVSRAPQHDAAHLSHALRIEGITATVDERAVRVRAAAPLTILSSAIIGGGLAETREIVNMRVDDVGCDERPEKLLLTFAATLGIDEPFVGLMTAAKTENARLARSALNGLAVASVVSMA